MALIPLPFLLVIACEVTVGYFIRIGGFILYLYVQSIIIVIVIIIIIIINTTHVEYKNKGDTSNNRRDWDHFEVIQKIREQHTRKSQS